MDTARADALSARNRIAAGAWLAHRAESFRHLPPPAAEVWLGESGPQQPGNCDASPLAGAGWTLHPLGQTPQGRVDARWLDAADPGRTVRWSARACACASAAPRRHAAAAATRRCGCS